MSGSKIWSLEGKALKLNTAEDIESHIKDLRDNEDVEEVRLLGNSIGIGASEALAKVLATKKKLQVANLADIFTARVLAEIPPALSNLLNALLELPQLHTVNLSDNAFGLNTQAPLVEFLSQHVPLRHLILNNNGLGPAAGILVAEALTTLAKKKEAARKEGKEVPNLETVICGRNRLENGSMRAWANAYAAHNGVKEVKMVQNGIRPVGIVHLLSNGLSHASDLRILDLQDNTFSAIGGVALGKAVGRWTEITELGVGDCLIKARGGVALASALQKGNNTKLQVLRLQFNDINAQGIEGLADAHDKLPVLRRLELNGNKFSEEDASIERLRAVLKKREEAADGEGEDDEDYWGLDDLDELDSDEDEDEEEDEAARASDVEEGVAVEERAAREIAAANQAENENVAQEKDKNVDDLADVLAKTQI